MSIPSGSIPSASKSENGKSTPRISVIGLGYVGLPLAVALARQFETVGYDRDLSRVEGLRKGIDRTNEVSGETLRASRLVMTNDPSGIAGCDIHIVTVPTPVDAENRPDLGAVRSASETVGRHIGRGAIVVFESTVYPGVTEDVCGPIIEKVSGLKRGHDFFLGYSPERINPGDKLHTVDRITKVVAGENPEIAKRLADVYGAITTGGTFIARDIRTAEAAKVIENAQRDINIAFINEATMIFNKLGISAYDVLEAAGTKWNFLKFSPGLVGGHCIGVDPFYLAHRAQEIGHDPRVILAGRGINDSMAGFIADAIGSHLKPKSRILVLGLTFKEDVPDLRNSKIADLVSGLSRLEHDVSIHDPLADPAEARHEYGVDLLPSLGGSGRFDCVVGAVPHATYRDMSRENIAALLAPDGLLADIKGMWRQMDFAPGIRRWVL